MFNRKPKTDAALNNSAPDSAPETLTLTPEDIVNKRFQPTKFREGYDQDEVDNFLDEIVVAFRTVIAKNYQLEHDNVQLRSTRQP